MTDERSLEELRQERETFEQAKSQGARWFTLRLRMGYVGILLLFAIAVIATYIVLHPDRYTETVVGIAATALLVDLVSLVVGIFKLVLQQNDAAQLRPVTRLQTPDRDSCHG